MKSQKSKSKNVFLHLSDLKSDSSSMDRKGNSKIKMNENDEKENKMLDKNYWYRGELMQLVPDVLNELSENQEIVIEQKIELLEVLTGCESSNRYNIYLLDKDKTKKFLFKCKEQSNWCCRNCCFSNMKSFDLKMVHIINSNKNINYKKAIAEFNKNFKCTCLCCPRQKMEGYIFGESENGTKKIKKPIGGVIEECSFGSFLLVYGSNDEIRWKIYSEYCQCGFCCKDTSLGKCYEVDFWIYDGKSDIKINKPVGNIHKVFKGLSELMTDSNAFILTFPKKATPIERLMLIGAVIMIDYRYFESFNCCDCGSVI
jgi:hypothetical protein